jgi:hypothetical protein
VLDILNKGDGVSYILLVTPMYGLAVWRTDGTLEGTRKQFDILEERWALPLGLTNGSDHILFFANDAIHGFELWRYNYPTTP